MAGVNGRRELRRCGRGEEQLVEGVGRRTWRPAMVPASLVACRCASLKWAGTVMTARVTGMPRKASASSLSCSSTMAEICSGAKARPASPQDLEKSRTMGLPDGPSSTLQVSDLMSA